jgi:hypothetical protein
MRFSDLNHSGSRRTRPRRSCLSAALSIRPRKIPAPRPHLIPLVFGHFDANPVVAPIEHVVRRHVRNRILIPQLVANILERLIQIIYVIRKERPSSRFIREVLQNLVAF